jgi:hypothetical protein
VDHLIAGLAAEQHGVLAAWQLRARGVSKGAVEHRLRSGRLHRLHRGVYAVGHTSLTPRARWMAAVLTGGPDAVLSHRAAAALWGILEPTSSAIAVTVPIKARPRAGIRFHRSRLPADERDESDGIPTTSVPRTILDLAPVLSTHRLERLIDGAEQLDLHDPLSLPDLLERYPRRPGGPRLRAILRARGGLTVTRSELEDRFLAFLADRGFPPPEVNATVEVEGRRFELDCYWPRLGIAVELDGYDSHSGRAPFRGDRIRDRRLRVGGIETVRVTWHDVTDGAGELEADLRKILSSAAG